MMKLLRKYNYLLIVLVFFVFLYLSYNSYTRTKEIIKLKHDSQQQLVEKDVLGALESANGAYSISEAILNREMENYSNLLLEKYAHNPAIMTWNLQGLKRQMNNEYDIYIINQDLTIVRTTFKPDLGLDFSRFNSFARLLKSRLSGDSFTADKMDISTTTGKIKKYSYMPTPDHHYLLELSINILDRYPILQDLNVFSLARQLVTKHTSVEDISFYKYNKAADTVGLIEYKKDPIKTDVPRHNKILVRKAILNNTTETSTHHQGNYTLTDKYIPFLTYADNGNLDWWNSYVVGITYNNKDMLTETGRETRSFLINSSIITVVFILFISLMIYLLKNTEHMAYHDHLTGLANRKALEKYYNGITGKNKLAVLYIDLDNFKSFNDNYGHELGDKLLTELGARLKDVVRARDQVSRMGGDEFAILLTDISSISDVERVIEKIKMVVEKPFELNDHRININCSIGMSLSPAQGSSLEEMINRADVAMYRAKRAKKNLM